MCIGGGGGSNAAADEARAKEKQRGIDVRRSIDAINYQFSPFDERYYGGIKDAALGVYMPDIARQYGQAQRRTAHGFNENGNLASSAAARTFGNLQDELGKNSVDAANKATDYANDQRRNIESSRSSLINQANAIADPSISFNNAASQAASLKTPQSFTPAGALFQNFSGLIGNGLAAERAGFGGFNTGLFGAQPRSTARVVG